jgi:hypothetical protein
MAWLLFEVRRCSRAAVAWRTAWLLGGMKEVEQDAEMAGGGVASPKLVLRA